MEVMLKEIGEIITGNTPSKKIKEFWDSNDICFIKPDIIADFGLNEIDVSNEYISECARKRARIVSKGSVFVTCIGSIGKIGIAGKGEYAFNQQINAIVPNSKINPRYLAYDLLFNKQRLIAISNAPVVPIINKSQFGEFVVNIEPDINKQYRIVDILDKLSLIINNRKEELNQLDNIIKARFVEMFGDPVRNSKNWNTEKLCSIAPINKYNGDIDTINGKVWLLNLDMIESCTGNIVDFLYEFENRITSSTIKFDENCVLYSKLRPYLNKVVIPERKGYATSELVSMSTEKVNKYFLANLLRQDSFVNFSNATAYGAKMPRASMDLIKNFDVINPPTELQNQFGKLVIEVEKSKLEVQRALDKAQLLFDSLMKKYFG